MTNSKLEPLFLNGSAGRIFGMLYTPQEIKGAVVFVPAFAEEMNKCRRQIANTARGLVANGSAVLVLDLFGTGDSEGEFSNATWETWKADIITAIGWMESEVFTVDGIAATRLGCALAAESIHETNRSVAKTLFWQPVASGRQFMTQFLRLRVAASIMEAGSRDSVESLREQLKTGSSLEVAGYELTSSLWRAIEGVQLSSHLKSNLGALHIVEVGRGIKDSLSVGGRGLMTAAEDAHVKVTGQRIPGAPIWASTEVVTNELLKKVTVDHLVFRD